MIQRGERRVAELGRTPEEAVVSRILHLNAVVTGVAAGVLAGAGMFVATNWLIFKGGERIGPHLALLGQFFIGYTVTFTGSLLGFGYGFVCGFLVGFFIASVHNWFADLRHRGPKAHA